MAVEIERKAGLQGRTYPLGFGIIDTDVHPYPRNPMDIKAYMPSQWRDQYRAMGRAFYDAPGSRLDSFPPGGGPAGSDPAFLRQQLMDEFGIDVALLLPRAIINMYPNADYAAAIARAFNDWLIDCWLDHNNEDGRFKGSITVATQDPDQAVREIQRVAQHPHMVQVMVDGGARLPYGQRYYHPIYAAAEEAGLPIAIHPGTEGQGINSPPTPVGYPSYYSEFHALLSLTFQAHLASMIFEGVFEKFPRLKIVFVEGGAAWLAPLLWRLDAHYRSLRAETPWLKKLPSEYVLEHVRLTTQPMEEAGNPDHILQILEMMRADQTLMFSSDYAHWDFDSPLYSLPLAKMERRMKERIFSDTARELYSLPAR